MRYVCSFGRLQPPSKWFFQLSLHGHSAYLTPAINPAGNRAQRPVTLGSERSSPDNGRALPIRTNVLNTIIILKLVLVPALVAAITLAGRRWGPAVAGWLSAFPVVSAPILLFIAFDQGSAFAADAAIGTLSAVLAILVFGLAYAWTARTRGWPTSLFFGFGAYAAAVVALAYTRPPLSISLPAVGAALLFAPRLYPSMPVLYVPRVAPMTDIPLRMIVGAVLTLLETQFARDLGSRLSGVLAMFPVMGSVLVVFSHRQAGAGFAIHLLKGMVLGYFAFATFCIVLALTLTLTLRHASMAAAFLFALGAAVAVQALTRLRLRHAS